MHVVRRGPVRFGAEVLFLVAVAAIAGWQHLEWWTIVVVMACAWLLVAVFERWYGARSRRRARAAAVQSAEPAVEAQRPEQVRVVPRAWGSSSKPQEESQLEPVAEVAEVVEVIEVEPDEADAVETEEPVVVAAADEEPEAAERRARSRA